MTLRRRTPRREREWRRWTGIEPAGQGSPIPPALKAGEPTRRSDTSSDDVIGVPDVTDTVRGASGAGVASVRRMSKNRTLLFVVLAVLLAVLARKVRDV